MPKKPTTPTSNWGHPKTLNDNFTTDDASHAAEPSARTSDAPFSHESANTDAEIHSEADLSSSDDDDALLGDLDLDDTDGDENAGNALNFANARPASERSAPKSPLVGQMSFLQFPLPYIALTAFQAWRLDPNHQSIIGEDQQWHPYKSRFLDDSDTTLIAEGISEMITDVIGRDLALDDTRPDHEKHYDFAALFGTTFHSLLDSYWKRGLDAQAARNADMVKQAIAQRLRLHFPEMSDDQIAYFVMGED